MAFVFPSLFTLFSIPLLAKAISGEIIVLLPALVLLGAAGFLWRSVLYTPLRIECDQAGRIKFVSLWGNVEFMAAQVVSIEPVPNQFGFFTIRYHGGKLRFLAQFDDFHVFLTWLKVIKPSVVLRGC